MATNNSLSLPPDVSTESTFRAFARAVSTQLSAMGLVKTADSGQINLEQAEVRALTANASFPAAQAFDANAALVYQSTAAPSVGTPQWLLSDAGLGNTFQPGSWAVYTSNLAADPKDVVLQYSADGVAWTDFDTRTLTLSTGYQQFNLVGAPARRYWRMLCTSTQGTSTYLQVSELQLWTGAGLTGLRATPATLRPAAANAAAGFEIWRLADGLQSTRPFFLKIEYGTGGAVSYPSLWLTVGTATDGAGTLTGVSVSERRQLSSTASSLNVAKCAISGAASRFAAAMFYNSTSYLFFALERTRTTGGIDTGDGLVVIGWNGATKFQMYLPWNGAPPATETDFGCVAPTTGTGLRSNMVSMYGIKPFGPQEMPQMLSAMAYFNTDLTAEVPVAGVQLFGDAGTPRTVMPLGNNISTIARGNINTRLALLWE
jgi:hypothetical protein